MGMYVYKPMEALQVPALDAEDLVARGDEIAAWVGGNNYLVDPPNDLSPGIYFDNQNGPCIAYPTDWVATDNSSGGTHWTVTNEAFTAMWQEVS